MPASFDVTMCQNQTVRFFGTSSKSHSVIRTGSYRKRFSVTSAPVPSAGRTPRMAIAANSLRFLRDPCVRSDRLRWYSHAKPHYLKARRHKAFHELMDPYTSPACPLVEHLDWVHIRIKLFPLAAPVGSNLLLADHTPTFRRLGPAYAVTHKGQCSINVPLVESRIDLSDEALCLSHSFLRAQVKS